MSEGAIALFLGIAAIQDWRQRKISNYLTFPALLVGLLVQFLSGGGIKAIGGVVVAFLLTLLPVLLRGMGMGDQKLLMALGAWTSHLDIYQIFLYSLLSCILLFCCSPATWRRLYTNMQLLSAGWQAHRQLWVPESARSALSFPYAVHLLFSFLFLTVLR